MAARPCAPPFLYIEGEHESRHAMRLFLECVVEPHIDLSRMQRVDLAVSARCAQEDAPLREAIRQGKAVRAVFKEPTVTPTAEELAAAGASRVLESPNAALRKGWRGVVISRDTIHAGRAASAGYRRPVLIDRHAVGGEYGAQHGLVGPGRVRTTFTGADGAVRTIADLELSEHASFVVTHATALDEVPALGRHFFSRALRAAVTPYVVTKRTVFRSQEAFWGALRELFDAEFRDAFAQRGLLARTGGALGHLLSDAAAMALVRWTDGGFALVALNYDGDVLTDLLGAVHGSPALVTSCLLGDVRGELRADSAGGSGTAPALGEWREAAPPIRLYEACHGTAADQWAARARGDATSFDPVGLIHGFLSALAYACDVECARAQPRTSERDLQRIRAFAAAVRAALGGTGPARGAEARAEGEEDGAPHGVGQKRPRTAAGEVSALSEPATDDQPAPNGESSQRRGAPTGAVPAAVRTPPLHRGDERIRAIAQHVATAIVNSRGADEQAG